MNSLIEAIGDADWVRSPADLAEYLRQLYQRFHDDPTKFENLTTDDFLEASSAWVEDSASLWQSRGTDLSSLNPWQVAAMVIGAGLIYE